MLGYDAIEKTCGLIDRSGDGRVRVTGADRVAWLQGLLTNDVAALVPGTGCYAAYLTPQGRMITDVRVLDRGDFLLLDLPGERTDAVLQRLETFIITEDVTLENVTASLARLGLHGPRAWATLAACVELAGGAAGGTEPLAEHASLATTFQGQPLIVAGSRDTGGPGFDLYIPADAAASLREALIAAGAEPADEEAWEARRIEAGRPRFGADLTEDTIPLEADLEERAISFTKGCYVGQEIIVRVMHRGGGRVARKLVGLSPAGSPRAEPVPQPGTGTPLFSGDREIGHLTSVAFSPALGHWIALGYVHRDFVTPGTLVQMGPEERRVPVAVAELPFVSHAAVR